MQPTKLTYFDLGVFCAKLREYYSHPEHERYTGNSWSVYLTLQKLGYEELMITNVGRLTNPDDVSPWMYRELIDEEWAAEMQHQVESIRAEYLTKQRS